MTSGKCSRCGEDKKNLEAHARFCKGTDDIKYAYVKEGENIKRIKYNPNNVYPLVDKKAEDIKQELPQKTRNWKRGFGLLTSGVFLICAFVVVAKRGTVFQYGVLFIISCVLLIWSMMQKPKKQPSIKKVVPIEEILQNLPEWSVKEGKPVFVSKEKKQRLIQFVGVSRVKRPVSCWVLWNGVYISIGTVAGEERLYFPPHDIRGDQFFYDLDRCKPLLDNLQPDDKESHESLRMGQIRNISFTLALLNGAKGLMNQLGTVQILMIIAILASIVDGILIYSMTKDVNAFVGRVNPMLDNATAYFASHP